MRFDSLAMGGLWANIDAMMVSCWIVHPVGAYSFNRHSVGALAWGVSVSVWASEWEFAASVREWDGDATGYWGF